MTERLNKQQLYFNRLYTAENMTDTYQLYSILDNSGYFRYFDISKLNDNIEIDSTKDAATLEFIYTGNLYQVANLEARILQVFESPVSVTDLTRDRLKEIISTVDCNISPYPEEVMDIRKYQPTVHQMRSGAPDKVELFTLPTHRLNKHDNTNLVSFTYSELVDKIEAREYLLPADEADIKYANDFESARGSSLGYILLPQVRDDNGNIRIIDYNKFVPKDSKVYMNLRAATGIIYPDILTLTPEQFQYHVQSHLVDGKYHIKDVAIKTTTGSGSRGVLLIDPSRVHLGGKYRSELTNADLSDLFYFAKKEGCNIMLQQLIPNRPDLLKCNTDFIIKNGELLGYKWEVVNQAQQFTNWDNSDIVYSPYTDHVMKFLVNYLVQECGIVNAIMNFESFSNMIDETWMIEFNYRYSNSMFELQAFGTDVVSIYLEGTKFRPQDGTYREVRYWQCALYNNIKDYHDGI